MGALVAPVGTVTWSWLGCVTVKPPALLPPNFTLIPVAKLIPSNVTAEPGAPAAGLKSRMTGPGLVRKLELVVKLPCAETTVMGLLLAPGGTTS